MGLTSNKNFITTNAGAHATAAAAAGAADVVTQQQQAALVEACRQVASIMSWSA
jgi:hypothetical protein